jgi:DNA-binding NtrC family response regulator
MAETTAVRILVADDQQDIIDALRLLLIDEGYEVSPARSPAEALERLEAADFDLALLDLNYTRDTTSGQEGFDLMERIRALDPTLPVLVMTAWSSVAGAVEAMRRGARDYIEKPWDDEKVLAAVRTQIELRRALRRSQRLQEANTRLQRGATPAFIGDTPAIREIRQTIERIAPSDASVLITGEHGTGKEVVAAWVHALSDRRGKPLVTMNAGGLAEGIAESELFGHVKGAFTDARTDRIGCFEMADEGTLFLDEIANMPVRLQAKLLRVLQTGEVQRVGSSRLRYVSTRVLSATNADLQEEIAAGRFREDLLYRLNTVVIHVPPLRERRDDVEPLARHFLAHYAARYRKPLMSFDRDARWRQRGQRPRAGTRD